VSLIREGGYELRNELMNGLICTGLKGNGYELGIRKGIKE